MKHYHWHHWCDTACGMSNVVIFVWGIIVSGFMFGGSGVYVCFFNLHIYTVLQSIYIHTYMYICNIHTKHIAMRVATSLATFSKSIQVHSAAFRQKQAVKLWGVGTPGYPKQIWRSRGIKSCKLNWLAGFLPLTVEVKGSLNYSICIPNQIPFQLSYASFFAMPVFTCCN